LSLQELDYNAELMQNKTDLQESSCRSTG